MKRLILAAALSLFAAAVSAQANYSGIWQTGNGLYVNIAQNGQYIITTMFQNVGATNIAIPLANGQRFFPPTIDIGEISSGQIVNGVGILNGTTTYQACTTVSRIIFTSQTTYTVTLLSINNTSTGFAQGINCQGVYAANGTFPGAVGTATKIF